MVGLGLEGLDKDDICRILEREHDVLVATHCSDRETTHIIRVQSCNWDFDDVEP